MLPRAVLGLLLTFLFLQACAAATPGRTETPPTSALPTATDTVTTSTLVTTTAAPVLTRAPVETHVAFVIGDFGDGTPAQYAVAATMQAYATRIATPDILLTTGDNFYRDDVEAIWEEPFGWVEELGISVWAAWGNHDIDSRSREKLVAETLQPPARWYKVSFGKATVLVLDANQPRNEDQLAWILGQLRQHANDLVLAVFHQPAHSCSSAGSTRAVLETWVPLFERFRVDLVLNGHDHNYQRISQNDVMYVVTGGGGASLRGVGDCPLGTNEPQVSNDTDHHFLILELKGETVNVQAVATDGMRLDGFWLTNDG